MESMVLDHLVDVLEDLEEEDLERFKAMLGVDQAFAHIFRGRLEGVDALELSQLLLSHCPSTSALEVASQTLYRIGLERHAARLLFATEMASVDRWAPEIGTSSHLWLPFKPGRNPLLKTFLDHPRSFPEAFAGQYGFELALQELQTMRPETCWYSQIMNRLYCLEGVPCPVPMKVSSPPPPGSIIHASIVHFLEKRGGHRTGEIHLPEAGTFLCPITKLKFEVKAAVTIEYAHRSWDQHTSMAEMQAWVVAGPLFDIRTDAEEKVAAVHLPHFLCLGGGETDISQIKIAHFVEGGLTLEKPARVTQFHAVLENPKFSLLGLVKQFYYNFFRVHAVVILYQLLKTIKTLNLYLVPNDSSLIQAIRDAEEMFHSVLVRKPPQTLMPLYYGSRYTASSSADLKIIPQELHFIYMNPKQQQSYMQFSIRSTERIDLSLKNKEDLCSVWDTSLEPEDLLTHTFPTIPQHSYLQTAFSSMQIGEERRGPQEPVSDELHFIDKHRAELIWRTSTVEGVLDLLLGTILDVEQYQNIVSEKTDIKKMRKLYELMQSWDRSCKDRLYDALKEKNPYLIAELEGRMETEV